MAIQIRRVNPFSMQDSLVEFFWRMRAWPYATRDDYVQNWEWRYGSLSDPDPAVWIIVDGNAVVGHIAVYFRPMRFDGHGVRVGVPANYLLDPAYRNTMIGARLASATRMTVRTGEIDMLLGYGNKIAHTMFLALGDRDIGAMQSFVDVRRWYPVLARRLPGVAFLAPVANAAACVRKALLRRRPSQRAQGLVARDLSIESLLPLERSHWSRSEGFVCDNSPAFLVNRYLKCPYRSHRIFGVIDERTGRLEGLVVTEGATRISIWECEVNQSVLSEVQAIELVLDAIPNAENVVVPLLPQSTLADDFTRAGFLRNSLANTDRVVKNTRWSAYWQPKHPLAALFAETQRWRLWYGWSHH